MESWPSGLRQRFAKPRGSKKSRTGSNPVLSAKDKFFSSSGKFIFSESPPINHVRPRPPRLRWLFVFLEVWPVRLLLSLMLRDRRQARLFCQIYLGLFQKRFLYFVCALSHLN